MSHDLPDYVVRARSRSQRLAAAARRLPRAEKARIMREIDAHAPELRALIQATGAVPIHLRVRDGGGWRDVLSPEMIRGHGESFEDTVEAGS